MKGSRKEGKGRRRGMALFIVMTIVVILGTMATLLWHVRRSGKPQEELIRESRQAIYLARAAQEHFVLKYRLLPTQLADAVAYAVGKNPAYDFSRRFDSPPSGNGLSPSDAAANPGPLFYFGQVTRIDNGGAVPRIRRQVDLENLPGGLHPNRPRVLLSGYLLDLASQYPSNDLDGIVVVHSAPHDDKAMGAGWRDPFIGNYAVVNAHVLGMRSRKADHDKESVIVVSKGSVKRAGQISLASVFDGRPRRLDPPRRSESRLEGPSAAFPEAKVQLEALDQHRKRLAADEDGKSNLELIDLASGRRTEIVTQSYLVSKHQADDGGGPTQGDSVTVTTTTSAATEAP